MAYERTNWQNGDVISSEKLNKMEAGIEYACSLEHEVEDPTEGQVLKYDAEKEKFVNADVPAAIETNIQNPTDGQTLKYDAESGKWVNGEGGGSGSLVVTATYNESTDTTTLDKTWQEIVDAYPNVDIHLSYELESSPHSVVDRITEYAYPLSAGPYNSKPYIVRSDFGSFYALSPNDYPTDDNSI